MVLLEDAGPPGKCVSFRLNPFVGFRGVLIANKCD